MPSLADVTVIVPTRNEANNISRFLASLPSELALVVVCILSVAVWTRAPAVLRRWRVHLWLPHPILIGIWLCFLSLSVIQALDRWYFGLDHVHPIVSELQESAELILYLGGLLFLVMAADRVRQDQVRMPSR